MEMRIAGIKRWRLEDFGVRSEAGAGGFAVEGGMMDLMSCFRVEGHVHGAIVNVDR